MKAKPPKKTLKEYRKQLQVEDLVAATRAARRKSMERLEDQGITALALFISDLLAEALEKENTAASSSSRRASS